MYLKNATIHTKIEFCKSEIQSPAICYRNIRSLLWEKRVLSSWDFFSSRCFWASSKRFTSRSASRSNGLLSTGLSAFSFAFSFIVFVCKLISDSERFDSWLQEGKMETNQLRLICMYCILNDFKIPKCGIITLTLYLETFCAMSKSLLENWGASSFFVSPLFLPSRRS